MRRIIPWFITVSLMAFLLYLDPGMADFRLTRVVADIIIVLLLGSILALIFAFITFQEIKYALRFRILLPIACSIVLTTFVVTFGYNLYLDKVKGVKLFAPDVFEKLKIPPGLDCSTIKTGKFIAAEDTFERQGNLQIEINGRTRQKTIYKVEWPTDNEYDLVSTTDSIKKIMVKVVDVTEEGYTCYCYSKGGKTTIRYFVKRMPSIL